MDVAPASIVLVGLCASFILTVVYGTGTKLSRFKAWRLGLVFLGISLVTVPLPLVVYYFPRQGRAIAATALALFVFSVLVIVIGTPDDEDDEG